MIRVIRVCDHCKRNVEIDLADLHRDKLDQNVNSLNVRVGFSCDVCIQGAGQLKAKAS